MLFFVDETKQTIAGQQVGAVGAVAVPTDRYNRFCRAVYRVKQDELGALELDAKELKGNVNLAKAAFKAESIQGHSPSLRAVERMIDMLQQHGAKAVSLWTTEPNLLDLRVADGRRLSEPYVDLMLRCQALMKVNKGQRGMLFFDQMGFKEDRRAGCAVQNFFTRSGRRYALDRSFLQVPHFTHSSLSPGLQAADLLAYLSAHNSDGFTQRPELKPWWDRFVELPYDYEIRGTTRSSCGSFVSRSPVVTEATLAAAGNE